MSLDHSQTIIEVQDVSFGYTDELVLKHVHLPIHKGDYVGIIGPNGGGKTTLLKIMLGLLKPRDGVVKIFGQDITRFKEWSRIGYVPQKAVHFEARFPATVEEVVTMGLYGKRGLLRWLTKDDRLKVQSALDSVDMLSFKDRLIGDLSGGQQQRAFIARSLVSEPEVIFLDEPTVGVDLEAQEQFYRLLKKLNQELQLTLVLVSHDIDVIAHEATEFACVNQSIVYHGNPKEFIKGDYIKELYGKDVKFILHDH